MEKTKCPYCRKIFEGFTEFHAQHILEQHIVGKHKEFVVFQKPSKIKIAEKVAQV